ncbi:hypothetical protein CM15mP37_05480 [bacterium]|nr:MAG: hypothetical protein CM15mP37_05480 [bacterium]
MTEFIGLITSAPAVIPTKPARDPFKTIDKSGFLDKYQDKVIAPNTPRQPRVVVTNTKDILPGSAERTEPPLNPYHPNHKEKPRSMQEAYCAP